MKYPLKLAKTGYCYSQDFFSLLKLSNTSHEFGSFPLFLDLIPKFLMASAEKIFVVSLKMMRLKSRCVYLSQIYNTDVSIQFKEVLSMRVMFDFFRKLYLKQYATQP